MGYITAAIRDLYENDRSSDHRPICTPNISFLSLLWFELQSFPRGNNSLTFSYILQCILPPPPLPPLVGIVLYCTVLYFTVMYQYNIIKHNTTQYNTILHNTTQCNTIQYYIIQYNTLQYNSIQNNTI